MKKQIEIYVRNSGDRNLLMLHVPEGMKERLIEGIRNGSFEAQDASIHLELSILNEWKDVDNPEHVRLEVNEITASYE
ncbi:hypothetical protein [Variovorax terrae]|uniref:Uncharacterized protein n=1 Tax=Variovorax terrae TaxID=2923278 RepID=A0A9X2AR51_9BURK|nr:hypothetical protein [Variovorax terrae]MCJ0765277.1 hypothetical protein [Variovorax terrae]